MKIKRKKQLMSCFFDDLLMPLVLRCLSPSEAKKFTGYLKLLSNNGEDSIRVEGKGYLITSSEGEALNPDHLLIYPNLASNDLTLDMSQLSAGPVELIIVNSKGKLIWQKNEIRSQIISLDLNQYLSGIYFLRLETKKGHLTKKLMIIH